MFVLPRGVTAAWTEGSWFPWLFGPRMVRGAAVVCPSGHAFSIGGGHVFGSCHSIQDDGSVAPSVVCPHCGWHVFIRLDSWKEQTRG